MGTTSSWLRSIFESEPEREYTLRELGGKKRGSKRERRGLWMGYDSLRRLIDELINHPSYAKGISFKRNAMRRSKIKIKGWVIIQYLDDNGLGKRAA